MDPLNETNQSEDITPLFYTPSVGTQPQTNSDPSKPLFYTPSVGSTEPRRRPGLFQIGKEEPSVDLPQEEEVVERQPTPPIVEGELPYFPGPYESKEYQEEPSGPGRVAAYTAQEFGKGVAGMADLASAVIDAAPVIGWGKHKLGQYFGVYDESAPYRVRFGDITELYEEEVVPRALDSIGYEGVDELKARSAPERGLGFLAENLGAFAPIKVGQMLLGAAKGAPVSVFDSLGKTELTASALGAGTGAAAYSLFESEESKEQAGYLGNFVGALFPMIKDLSMGYQGYSAVKRYYGTSRLKPGEIDDLSDTLINQDIARIIQEEDIPKIQERITQLRAFQEIEPEFTVTASSLIRTPYARQVQNLTDTQNPELATQIYEKNRAIVNKWIAQNGIDEGSENFEAIQEAVFNVAAQGEEVARSYARQIDSIKDDIRSLGRTSATTDPLEVGQDYREQLVRMESMFKNHVDTMYRAVDPDNKIKIGISDVYTNMIDTRREFISNTPTGTINYETDPGNYLLRDLEAIVDKFDPSKYKVTNPRVNFNSLIEQRKQLDSIARAAPKGSQAYALSNSLARSLDNQLDNIMLEASGDTLSAYSAARASYRDYYLPVFMQKNSLIVKHLSTYTPRDVDYRQAADRLLRDVWTEERTPTELGAVQINQMLEKATDITDPDALRVAREALDLRINDYAVSSLNRELRNSERPAEAFRKWKEANEVNIKNFPHVQNNVDEIGRQLTLKEMQVDKLLEQESFVNNTIIRRYGARDAEKFVEELGRMSASQASTTLKEMMYGAGVKSPYINLPFARDDVKGSLLDLSPNINSFLAKLKRKSPETHAIASQMHGAVSSELLNRVIRKGARNDGYGGLNASFFNSIFNGNNDSFKLKTLRQIMTPEDYSRLQDFHVLANATSDSFTPSGKIDMSMVERLEKEVGISLSSVSSRIYAQQLGKVGPVFIVADTGTKLLKAWHINKFNDRLRDVMYDIDALEDVVSYRAKMLEGAEKEVFLEQMTFIQGYKDKLKKFSVQSAKAAPSKIMDVFEALIIRPTWPNDVNRFRALMEEKIEQNEESSRIEQMIEVYTRAYEDMPAPVDPAEWEAFRATLRQPLQVEEDEEEMQQTPEPVFSPELESKLDGFLSSGLEDGKTYIIDKQTGEIREEGSETND